jgi:hypothetical protein
VSHDRVVFIIAALCRLTRTWGDTLRLVTVILAVGVTLAVLAVCTPWDDIAALFRLGG